MYIFHEYLSLWANVEQSVVVGGHLLDLVEHYIVQSRDIFHHHLPLQPPNKQTVIVDLTLLNLLKSVLSDNIEVVDQTLSPVYFTPVTVRIRICYCIYISVRCLQLE